MLIIEVTGDHSRTYLRVPDDDQTLHAARSPHVVTRTAALFFVEQRADSDTCQTLTRDNKWALTLSEDQCALDLCASWQRSSWTWSAVNSASWVAACRALRHSATACCWRESWLWSPLSRHRGSSPPRCFSCRSRALSADHSNTTRCPRLRPARKSDRVPRALLSGTCISARWSVTGLRVIPSQLPSSPTAARRHFRVQSRPVHRCRATRLAPSHSGPALALRRPGHASRAENLPRDVSRCRLEVRSVTGLDLHKYMNSTTDTARAEWHSRWELLARDWRRISWPRRWTWAWTASASCPGRSTPPRAGPLRMWMSVTWYLFQWKSIVSPHRWARLDCWLVAQCVWCCTCRTERLCWWAAACRRRARDGILKIDRDLSLFGSKIARRAIRATVAEQLNPKLPPRRSYSNVAIKIVLYAPWRADRVVWPRATCPANCQTLSCGSWSDPQSLWSSSGLDWSAENLCVLAPYVSELFGAATRNAEY